MRNTAEKHSLISRIVIQKEDVLFKARQSRPEVKVQLHWIGLV